MICIRWSTLTILAWLLLSAAAWGQTLPATAPALAPIPTSADQSAALVLVKNTYAADYAKLAPADRVALAKKLLADGLATRDSLAARYVLFDQSADLASTHGDAATALHAIDALAASFANVDALELKARLLARVPAARCSVQAHESNAELALAATYAAVAADRFDLAEKLAATAEAAAAKTQRIALITSIQSRLADYRTLAAEWQDLKVAREVLRTTPDDGAANLLLGRYYALSKSDWPSALPHLAKGNDAKLRALAEKELAHPADALTLTALGDAWWDCSDPLPPRQKTAAARHAIALYQSALPELTGLSRERLLRRIKSGEPGGAETQPAKLDLLALADPARDTVEGVWKVEKSTLICVQGPYARLQLPLVAPEEYDLRITFARTDGDGPVMFLLTAGTAAFGVTLDAPGHFARIERIDGKVKEGNPTQLNLRLDNDRRYTALVQVRKDGVKTFLDDKPLHDWKGDLRDLSRYSRWKLTDNRLLGLAAANRTVFLKAELTTISGEFKKTRDK